MTENEAIKVFKELLDVPCEMLVKYDSVATEEQKKALVKIRVAEDIAIQALEEIQEYRAIGTIEEFKALKEKAEPKKPIRSDLCTCPRCGTHNEIIKKRRNTVTFDTVYCWHCGQAIEIKRD